MAHKRAPIVSVDLADFHIPLPHKSDQQSPVEAPSDSSDHPEPMKQADAPFPSVVEAEAKDRLVSYSVRLKLSQVEQLEKLKAKRGIVPSKLLRDFIDRCLPQV